MIPALPLLISVGLKYARTIASYAIDHWKIFAVVALIVAYGWHKHVAAQRDAFEAELANVRGAAQALAEQLRHASERKDEYERRGVFATDVLQQRTADADASVRTIIREVVKNADPNACPIAASVRASLAGLRDAGAGSRRSR